MGISQVHSPREIFTKCKLDRKKHWKSGFVDFMQASYDCDTTNRVVNMRTYDGIYLGPMGNIQGAVNFFVLETSKVKNLTRLCLYQSQTA